MVSQPIHHAVKIYRGHSKKHSQFQCEIFIIFMSWLLENLCNLLDRILGWPCSWITHCSDEKSFSFWGVHYFTEGDILFHCNIDDFWNIKHTFWKFEPQIILNLFILVYETQHRLCRAFQLYILWHCIVVYTTYKCILKFLFMILNHHLCWNDLLYKYTEITEICKAKSGDLLKLHVELFTTCSSKFREC